MKKSIFLSFILCLCLIACIPQQAMAQKQSRMEKLLRYLNDNDADKWQKNREKLDDETKAYYAEDLSLMDVLNDLWNEQSEQAATLYFGCYEKAAQSNFPGICEGEKIPLSQIRDKADQSIINLLEASKDKIPFSRTLLDSIHATEYPVDSAMLQRLQNIREVALLEGMLKAPTPIIYQTYVKEYPNGKFIAQVNASENVRLYQLVKTAPTPANFKAFFEDPEMQKYYQDRGPRPYLAEVRTLYDDFLFQRIDSLKKEGNATAIRQIIDDYKNTPYLSTGARTHLNDLEYLSEKADFELLKPAIVNSESLGLLQEFLKTHKYKEFRDQAKNLRAPFILQAIVSTPTTVKYYTQGRLIKCCETDSTGNITTSYTYNDKGHHIIRDRKERATHQRSANQQAVRPARPLHLRSENKPENQNGLLPPCTPHRYRRKHRKRFPKIHGRQIYRQQLQQAGITDGNQRVQQERGNGGIYSQQIRRQRQNDRISASEYALCQFAQPDSLAKRIV